MTIHERVREAGDAKVREVAHKTGEADHTHDRDAMYAKLLDPSSNFPEPALKGDHLQQVMRGWMPSPPTSPAGGRHKKKSAHQAGADQGGGKRLPVAGVRGGVEARDEPNDVNHDVGEFMAKTISPHGHAHTARDSGGGFADAHM